MTREEAIKGLKRLSYEFSGYKPNEEMFDMAIKALEQKTGHWEPKIDFDDTRYGYICNRCRNWVRDKSDYCPNCGAKMVESEE